MKKKILLGLSVSLALLVAIAAFFLTRNEKQTSPAETPTPEVEEKQEKLAQYEDEAGFNFEYPEGLMVRDVTPEDKTHYSLLEISSSKAEGKMTIEVVDTVYSSVEDWLKKDKQASSAGQVSREITLGGIVGKQIQTENPRQLMTVAINEKVLFLLISPLETSNGQYWNKIHNDIMASFQISQESAPAANETENSVGSGDSGIVEEEEIIE